YRRTGNTTWNDLTIPLPLKTSNLTLGAQGSGTNTADVRKHEWTGGEGEWEFRLCVNRPITAVEIDSADASNCSVASAKIIIVPKLIAKVDLTVDVVPTGSNDQPDTISASYGTKHILRWKGTNVVNGACTLALTSAIPIQILVSNGSAENLTGVEIGPMVNPQNEYQISCTAVPNAIPSPAMDGVSIGITAPTVSCAPSPTSAHVNETITWTAFPRPDKYPGTATAIPYGFSWTSTGGSPASGSGNPFQTKYASPNPSTSASITLSAPGGRTASAVCQPTVPITALPDLASAITLKNKAGAVVQPNQPYFSGEEYKLSGTVSNGGDADTPTGFSNLYQYTQSQTPTAPTSENAWSDWGAYETSALAKNSSRAVSDNPWTPGPGKYWFFRLCADQKVDGALGCTPASGTITEKNDGNNNSVIGPYEFIARPSNATVPTIACNGQSGVATLEYSGT
ncbi:MAG: hypothetical protein AAB570_01920, partial [Patescibacteria group bacterium]